MSKSKSRHLAELISSSGALKADKVADDSVDSAHIKDGSVDDVHITNVSASKLTGALPAISGSNLTGVQPFPSGTVMVFYQASAPTGWTKSTTHNDKALRVVSGSGAGSGGTHGLSSPPSTAHTHTQSAHTHSIGAHSHGHSLSAASHTLSSSQMPSHRHQFYGGGEGYSGHSDWHTTWGRTKQTAYTGGGGSHSHSMSGSISNSSAYTSGSGGSGSTSSSGPTAFAPQYIDVIICSKT